LFTCPDAPCSRLNCAKQSMLTEHEIEFRVRYHEADAMGFVHHANYFKFFEMGRIELLRANGGDYARMEREGLFVVVVKAECRFQKPARFDDVLRLRTRVARITEAKIEHEYELFRGSERLALGRVTLAVVNRQGEVQAVPDWLKLLPAADPDGAASAGRGSGR